MKLGFNTSGNSQTSGRTTQAILGLGCLRNTKGSLTRKFKYCNERDRNYVFQCVFNQPIPLCPSITTISLADIATFGSYGPYTGWLLNGNTTILLCEVLEIPATEYLFPNHFTLTNNGTINLRGIIRNAQDTGGNDCITINNGTINIFSTGTIVAVDTGSIITNNGIVNNYGDFLCQTSGVINNTAGGRINNYSAFSGGTGGFRVNYIATFKNVGVFINNTGATILNANNATGIYNYGGGTIINNGTFTNNGNIFTGNSTCGIGTITGTIINTGTITTGCPSP
jgi:hypothetical protein